ncbi:MULTISPECIES: hypothetical protein [unclassified Polaribacter]|uniref:hypothetical protein n=1 Tax=unclassified Polaribacter TaxID=196858 RepID=UPI0011BF7B7D|nr:MULTISPECIES: hypothetical protein [unclassified Polaribacter]TXD51115.1 hypothetical protein ES043_13380 [Polaribacter sp. IC063]
MEGTACGELVKIENKALLFSAIDETITDLDVLSKNYFTTTKYKQCLFIEVLCALFCLQFYVVLFLADSHTNFTILIKEKTLPHRKIKVAYFSLLFLPSLF